jgi:hypothetical protein
MPLCNNAKISANFGKFKFDHVGAWFDLPDIDWSKIRLITPYSQLIPNILS